VMRNQQESSPEQDKSNKSISYAFYIPFCE
jgi:hypothetical protein